MKSPTGLTLGFGISFSGILVFALHHRSVLVASAHGEVEGGADGEGEDESLALAGQCLAEIQTLSRKASCIYISLVSLCSNKYIYVDT